MRAMRLTAFAAVFIGILVVSVTCQEVEDLAPELEACRAQVRVSAVHTDKSEPLFPPQPSSPISPRAAPSAASPRLCAR